MSDKVDKLMAMVSKLSENVEKQFNKVNERFDKVDGRLDNIEKAIKDLNLTQVKILNSIELIEKDIESNRNHIERLEKGDLFV